MNWYEKVYFVYYFNLLYYAIFIKEFAKEFELFESPGLREKKKSIFFIVTERETELK